MRRGARAWGRDARFTLEVKKKLPKPAAETSTRCAERGSFSRFDPDRGGRDGWKLKRNFQTGRRKLPRETKTADRLDGSRSADRGGRTMARGSINRRYLSSNEFLGRVRRGSGADRSSVNSFWL